MAKIKVLELFGGIAACSAALHRLGFEVETADYVEIDKYAVASYNAMYGTNFVPQDITKWDKDIPDVDLVMHGSPCQDISLAGLQKGADEGSGTRSSLMYETIRIVDKLKPKYVCWENVKNLVSKKHFHNFQAYLDRMEELGYKSYWKVLNSKDYGIPQNRERVFTISIRNDIDKEFIFPEPFELRLRLKDMLEDEVDDKYYLSDKQLTYVLDGNDVALSSGRNINDRTVNPNIAKTISCRGAVDQRADVTNFVIDGCDEMKVKEVKDIIVVGNYSPSNHEASRVLSSEGIAPTIKENHGTVNAVEIEEKQPWIAIKNATKLGYLIGHYGDGVDISSRMKYHRGNVQPQMAHTIDTKGGASHGVIVWKKT